MIVRCAICGFVGTIHEYVDFTKGDRSLPEVWLCDECPKR